jgi:hypothetical protein
MGKASRAAVRLLARSARLKLKEDDGVGVANGIIKKSLRLLGTPRGDDLEAGDRSIAGGIILGMLGDKTVGASSRGRPASVS